jgi:hypothetical protein
MSAPSRFPDDVAEALTAAGWRPGRHEDATAQQWRLLLASRRSRAGGAHAVVDAAVSAFAEFGGLRVELDGAGSDVARTTFTLDPMRAVDTVDTLAGLAAVLEVPLTPLGVEGDGGGILAIDDRGRVFVVDHTGEWFLGATVDEALTTLIQGLQPPKLRDDGTWD